MPCVNCNNEHEDAHVLRGDLDKFPEQLNSLAHRLCQTHLGDDPVLDLVEPAQQRIQIGGRPFEITPPEHRVDQLILTATINNIDSVAAKIRLLTVLMEALLRDTCNARKVGCILLNLPLRLPGLAAVGCCTFR